MSLLFPSGERLRTEAREVPEATDPSVLGVSIVQALLDGPQADLEPAVASGAELRAFFLDGNGVAYIDLDRKALNIPRDALGEYLSIECFYQSLRRNIPEVSGVKFWIDAREVDSLWGHFDGTMPWNLPYEE